MSSPIGQSAATQSSGQIVGSHPVAPPAEEPTVGRLVADASTHLSTLLRSEIALAKSELKVSAVAGGIGAALLGAAAFLLLLGVIMISIAFAYALVAWFDMDPAWAFLIVFGVYVVLAAILAMIGIGRLKKVSAPERTITTTKDTVATLRRR